jgi:hypothetical protein
MLLSLAFVLASTPESNMHAAFQSTAGDFFNAWGQVVVEMAHESQMTRPTNDTSSHFDSIGSQPAQGAQRFAGEPRLGFGLTICRTTDINEAKAAFAVE